MPSTVQLLTFLVDSDEYALDIMRVREIARPLPVRPIPGAPAGLVGVINLRHTEVIPIIDLRRRFELPPAAELRNQRIIVCVVEARLIGLFVDEVVDVVNVERRDIHSGSGIFRGKAAGLFAGVCHVRNRLLVLLNLKRLLSSEDRIAIDAVRQEIASARAGEES
ncbi:MAG: chemotaxis protein CheW [Pseudomonadota bacterium]